MRKLKAKEKAEKERVKAERVRDNQRREDLKSPGELTEDCRKIVQAIARNRDRHDPCISCGIAYGAWDGSHFRPAGNNSAVELHLWNIHQACVQCNQHKHGNLSNYRPRLIDKIGEDRVKWLESQNQPVKRTRQYLLRFKAVMGKRLRRQRKWAKEKE